ncbi:hypothetical protein [Leucobacter chromiireducens]|uniref:hypothetical protein n=1 Tax=Leucobacter chromiireducens TaxID=283877 RepID=UPI001F14CA25|nr:hypothetical protein [Leucobacter chromiireducens]
MSDTVQESMQHSGNRTRGERVPAIERASRKPWGEWVTLFEAADAATLPHPEIARIARAELPADLANPDWWAQGIAIAYEQHAGLRVPGQSSTGTFRVSASRTLPLDRDAAIAAWREAHGDRAEHLGHAAGEPRPSRTEKRSFWRFDLAGAGRVEVSATPKDQDRAVLTVSLEGLPDGDRIEEWRAHWKALLAAL